VSEVDPETRFVRLYDAHHPRVYAYLVSRAGHQIAEDVASDTFLVAWRRLSEIPDAELAWLLGVARNRLHEVTRAAVHTAALTAELRVWIDQLTRDIADSVVERASVLRALSALSDEDRELLTLVAWHGLSTSQGAQVVGCSRPAYFVRLHRARRRLQRALSEMTDNPPARRYAYQVAPSAVGRKQRR
jgi:RNA polymerase sigma-70 factor (ECF subfamily)